jgi:CBS domain-containing protein
MHRDSALPTRHLAPGASLAQAEPWLTAPVTQDSPALAVMTDLTKTKAATTGPSTTLRQAEQLMIYQGVRMLFVVSEMPALEGLITSTDLRGDRAMRIVQQRGAHYDELSVGDVMIPLTSLDAIDLDRMRTATVSNVIATLKKHGRNHLIVVDYALDGAGAEQRVCGVISRAQIERQLGEVIELVPIADSFAEIGQMLS